MSLTRLFITTLIIFSSHFCVAQTDSIFQALENLQKVPVKYLNKVENILDQVSPETSAKLFGSNATTFGSLLKKLQEGKTIAEGYKTKYNEYRDKLTTSIKYLEDQKDKLDKKLIQPINTTKKKLNELEEDVSNTEAVEAFIKERKQQLLNEALKYIGRSKL